MCVTPSVQVWIFKTGVNVQAFFFFFRDASKALQAWRTCFVQLLASQTRKGSQCQTLPRKNSKLYGYKEKEQKTHEMSTI